MARRIRRSGPRQINGTEGNDNIDNIENKSAVADNSTISGFGGNDTISNTYSEAIRKYTSSIIIYGGDGDDRITNVGPYPILNGDAGDDYINNSGDGERAHMYGGDGDDTIVNSLQTYGTYAGMVLLVGGNGNDHIKNNFSKNSTIEGGAGDDVIENGGASVTINGGLGDDRISLKSGATNNLIQYNAGDGNDTIIGFNETSTLKIGDGTGTYSTLNDNSDVIVSVGSDRIILKDAASLSSLNIQGTVITIIKGTDGDDSIDNSSSRSTIDAGKGNDSISNSGDNVTITGGNGNDTITLTSGATNNLIQYASGDGSDRIQGINETSTLIIGDGTGTYSTIKSGSDIIVLVGEDKITLQGAADLSNVNIDGQFVQKNFDNSQNNTVIAANDLDNTIENSGSNVTIQAEGGNDYIENNNGSGVSINGGEGNDTIENNGSNVTINGGEGDDLISLAASAKNNVIVYTNGDGNDVIQGFNSTSTLEISGDYSTEKSGNDIVVTVRDEKITLQGAAALSNVNIVETPVNVNNSLGNKLLSGGNLNDTIFNSGQNVTIDALGSNDSIKNDGKNVSINGGAGSTTRATT